MPCLIVLIIAFICPCFPMVRTFISLISRNRFMHQPSMATKPDNMVEHRPREPDEGARSTPLTPDNKYGWIMGLNASFLTRSTPGSATIRPSRLSITFRKFQGANTTSKPANSLKQRFNSNKRLNPTLEAIDKALLLCRQEHERFTTDPLPTEIAPWSVPRDGALNREDLLEKLINLYWRGLA